MAYTRKRMVFMSLAVSIFLTIVAIYVFETNIVNSTGRLISSIFAKDDYEYSISIPDYWERYYTSTTTDLVTDSNVADKIIYTGNNGEYLALLIEDKPELYDATLYSTYISMDIRNRFLMDKQLESLPYDGKYIYYTQFEALGINYVIGFVENKGFLLKFEYKRPSSNNINEGLYAIISSVERFKVEEVDSIGQTTEE